VVRDPLKLVPDLGFGKIGKSLVCAGSERFVWKKGDFSGNLSQWQNVGSKMTVSWGIVQPKPKIGPLLGRSFEKWNVL